MSQSGVIFGAIALAFLVYITRKGELPIYAGLLLLGPSGTPGGSGSISPDDLVSGAFKAIALGGA